MTVLAVLFWVSAALLVYAQVGYGLLLAALAPLRRGWDRGDCRRTSRRRRLAWSSPPTRRAR